MVPVLGIQPMDEKANTLREPIDPHEDEKFEDHLEVPPRLVVRGPDAAGELEDEEGVEDQVEEEEEEKG